MSVIVDGRVVGSWVLDGMGRPDLAAVDRVARRALAAARAGGRLVLDDVDPAMLELMALAGLAVEVQGQAEGGEEPLGVDEGEEEGHLDDVPP